MLSVVSNSLQSKTLTAISSENANHTIKGIPNFYRCFFEFLLQCYYINPIEHINRKR